MTILLIWLSVCFLWGLGWGLIQKSFYYGLSLFLVLFFSPLLIIVLILIKISPFKKLKAWFSNQFKIF